MGAALPTVQIGEKVTDERPPGAEKRVLKAIASCRTAALGGHVQRCDRCSHLQISYNSCRNRHCPKCQESARAKWLAEREKDLLPVEYFHVVFTLPQEIAAPSVPMILETAPHSKLV